MAVKPNVTAIPALMDAAGIIGTVAYDTATETLTVTVKTLTDEFRMDDLVRALGIFYPELGWYWNSKTEVEVYLNA